MKTHHALFLVLVLARGVVACGSWFQDIDDAEIADVAARLSKCRAEGRDAGSYSAYERCKIREGLTKPSVAPVPRTNSPLLPDVDQ